MKKKQIVKVILAAVFSILIGVTGIQGTMAYLNDSEQHINAFTIGDVKIDLTETAWNKNAVPEIVPFRVIAKNPKITNTGVNDAVVFMKLTVPVHKYKPINPDGSKGAEARQELFFMQKAGTAALTQANTFNTSDNGWTELPQFEEGTDHSGNTRTYVFGYRTVLHPLASGSNVSATLFDQIMAANIPTEYVPTVREDIKVEAYAIQAKSVIDQSNGNTINTKSTVIVTDDQGTEYAIKELISDQISVHDLEVLYKAFVKQGSKLNAKEADTGNKLDLGGNSRQ